jgi:hypothetical protein
VPSAYFKMMATLYAVMSLSDGFTILSESTLVSGSYFQLCTTAPVEAFMVVDSAHIRHSCNSKRNRSYVGMLVLEAGSRLNVARSVWMPLTLCSFYAKINLAALMTRMRLPSPILRKDATSIPPR